MKIEQLQELSNEQLDLLVMGINEEKKRRQKIDKRDSALLFREALDRFLNSGAYADFHCVCEMSPCDVDIIFDCDCEYGDEHIESVDVPVFEREILLAIKNELTKRIGNYEG